ncbi:hypothetical protein EGI26_05080 [Lacihabitans sp. CCS-44]|uniref:hypothetical protein n=1 Tax=Lacihabitans sp. CCS-44 TaxID=2487331 RepID=UPI0020CDA368|nr:hypothetical protein [Lacihabitans sp. CCS-44]MCP9754537.1 hypothetical protein [Lacihabitans sp. CCS-44]
MSNFNFYGSVKGNHHFGDTYNFSSPNEFYSLNKENDFTATERELVKVIFENTTNEDERQELLTSLKKFKDEPTTPSAKDNHTSVLSGYIEKGKKLSNEVLFQVVVTYLAELIGSD